MLHRERPFRVRGAAELVQPASINIMVTAATAPLGTECIIAPPSRQCRARCLRGCGHGGKRRSTGHLTARRVRASAATRDTTAADPRPAGHQLGSPSDAR